MATWEDGPEYAPVEWPSAFVAPSAPPLSDAEPYVSSAGASLVPPQRYVEPTEHVPALADLVPAPSVVRDPTEPFQVTSAVMTAGSAWGSAHSTQAVAAPAPLPAWTPDQAVASAYPPPPATQGFPAPGTPEWFGPQTVPYEAGRVHVPLSFGTVAEGMSWGLIITLLLGGILSYLSPVLLLIAFFLSGQVRYRRRAMKIALVVAMVIVVIAGAGAMAGTSDSTLAWESMDTASVWCSWLLLVVGASLSAFAIRRGETPES
ncbi:MAG TPA: hypothetical protein VFK68_09685 [Propionibacteriaceae bacterium]|nr:hypothetical protein [Propionibacteriaceae bacterium]